MRVDPSKKALKGNQLSAAEKAKIEKITRIIALVIAAAGTYIFFFKILFF